MRQLLAAKSEQRSEQQALLFNDAEAVIDAELEKAAEPAAVIVAYTHKKPGRKPLNPKLQGGLA